MSCKGRCPLERRMLICRSKPRQTQMLKLLIQISFLATKRKHRSRRRQMATLMTPFGNHETSTNWCCQRNREYSLRTWIQSNLLSNLLHLNRTKSKENRLTMTKMRKVLLESTCYRSSRSLIRPKSQRKTKTLHKSLTWGRSRTSLMMRAHSLR